MSSGLHYDTLGDGVQTAWILHGILGSGRNWRSFARGLARRYPEWRFVLPDLRNHGQTGPLPGPNDLEACARDLAVLPEPAWVMGHSFGGKVALQWARDRGADQSVWVLDSVPFADDASDSDVMRVLGALEATTTPAAERKDLRDQLDARGLPAFLVNWLLTSAYQADDGWRWVYDLVAVREMMASYFVTDFGPDLDRWSGTDLHIVRAERSDRWRPEWIEVLENHPRLSFHTLPDAGHWLHVDNPQGLQELLHP